MVNSAEELTYNKKFSKSLLGLSLEEVERKIAHAGLVWRISEQDGISAPGSREVDVKRLNLNIRKGKVIDVEIG